MKKSLIIIAIALAAVLTACGAKEELVIVANSNERMADKLLSYNKDLELKRIEETARIKIEIEKTKQEKYKSDEHRYMAYRVVALQADAGGRVAIARSLEEKPEAQVQSVSVEKMIPAAAPIQLPTLQMPKSPASEVREWFKDVGVPVLGLFTNGFVAVKQSNNSVRITESNNRAATAQHEATMGAFRAFSDGQVSLGTAIANANGSNMAAFMQMLRDENANPDIVANNGAIVAANGSTVVVNTTQCSQEQNASGGNGASGGNSGDGGDGGNGGTQTSPGGAGASAREAGTGGGGGRVRQTGRQNCTSGK